MEPLSVSVVTGAEGNPDSWVIAVHVTDQAKMKSAVIEIFENDSQADGPIRIDDALLILFRPDLEQEQTSDHLAPILVGGDAKQHERTRGIGIFDGQLLIASDFEILSSIAMKRDHRNKLADNRAFTDLALRMQEVTPRCCGRIFAMGDISTLPPFIPKLLEQPTYPMPRLPNRSAVSGLSIRKTGDGFVVEGVELAAKNEHAK